MSSLACSLLLRAALVRGCRRCLPVAGAWTSRQWPQAQEGGVQGCRASCRLACQRASHTAAAAAAAAGAAGGGSEGSQVVVVAFGGNALLKRGAQWLGWMGQGQLGALHAPPTQPCSKPRLPLPTNALPPT